MPLFFSPPPFFLPVLLIVPGTPTPRPREKPTCPKVVFRRQCARATDPGRKIVATDLPSAGDIYCFSVPYYYGRKTYRPTPVDPHRPLSPLDAPYTATEMICTRKPLIYRAPPPPSPGTGRFSVSARTARTTPRFKEGVKPGVLTYRVCGNSRLLPMRINCLLGGICPEVHEQLLYGLVFFSLS